MNKYELVAYLANLTFIFDFHERMGTTKNPLLLADFARHHALLLEALKKEQENVR